MKSSILFFVFAVLSCSTTLHLFGQLKVTGGIEMTRGTIQRDVLLEVIQKKQEEVFNRLFANIIVNYFRNTQPNEGVVNFPMYYGLYNVMTDLTIGKSKTTVSKALVDNISEIAFIYSFVLYYQQIENGRLPANVINNSVYVKSETMDGGAPKLDKMNVERLNRYMDAAYQVLAHDSKIQNQFYFKRSVTSPEISQWYQNHYSEYEKPLNVPATAGGTILYTNLVAGMQAALPKFSLTVGRIGDIATLAKDRIGFSSLTIQQIQSIKLTLLEIGEVTDYLFNQNIIKRLLNVIVENTHTDTSVPSLDQVYIDVEGLILSIDKDFIPKNKRSSVSARLFFLNPRPFLTIGTSNGFFLLSNKLGGTTSTGELTSLHNINFASEKIGFRFKLFDLGYSRSFGPGETFKYKGTNRVWTQPQRRTTVTSMYYSIYASGLLYNLLDLKTDKNFDYGLVATNLGCIFFNGLELSAGVGWVYDGGFSTDNALLKIDFDIPIVDYLTALKKKHQ